jgi:hypothetical protein
VGGEALSASYQCGRITPEQQGLYCISCRDTVMSGAVVSLLWSWLTVAILTDTCLGPRGSLPNSPVTGVDEEQAKGSGDWPQLAEEKE